MTKTEIILFLTAVVSLITTLYLYYEQMHPREPSEHICIYNENPKCYERPCGDCNVRDECQKCCGGDCETCAAYKEV